MKSYFYPQSIYTATIAFAEIFKDITVRVYDNKTNAIVGVKPVPVTLTPREKVASILAAGNVNDVDPQVDNYLPRISIVQSGIDWDSSRMRGKNDKRLINIEYADNGQTRTIQTDHQSVPYNITFEVTVWAKYMVDGMQILENIMPWFAPEIHVSYKERNFGIEHKAKVTQKGVSSNHVYEYGEAGEAGRRFLQWTFTFEMEATMWKPLEIKPEILCNIISIAEVPCKKLPFQGIKIVSYDPVVDEPISLFDKETTLGVFDLDAKDSYDLMTNFWKITNTNMSAPTYQSCVDDNCATDPGPEPIWDPALNVSPCVPPLKNPVLKLNTVTNTFSNYYQQAVVINNVIEIVSYVMVFNNEGAPISGPTIIDNSVYPTDTNINNNGIGNSLVQINFTVA